MKNRVVIIDDEENICTSLGFALGSKYDVESFTDPQEGLQRLRQRDVDVVLLDLRLGKFNGLELIKEIKDAGIPSTLILMTAFGGESTAIEAIKEGAFEYLTKPIDLDELRIAVSKAIGYRNLQSEINYYKKELQGLDEGSTMIAKSPKMLGILKIMEGLKNADSNVLIRGENGSGKELLAGEIHRQSKRREKRYAIVRCSGITDDNIDSELLNAETGLLPMLEGGTVFFDEISAFSLSSQQKLHKYLFEHNVRTIAASSKSMKELVAGGKFSQEFYYFINVALIRMPALRERREDIIPLSMRFLEKYSLEQRKNVTKISTAAQELLQNYSYPGNVRQLANIIEYGVILSNGDTLGVFALPDELDTGGKQAANIPAFDFKGKTMAEIEKMAILSAIEENGGNKQKAAEQLGLSERTLWNKLKEYKN